MALPLGKATDLYRRSLDGYHASVWQLVPIKHNYSTYLPFYLAKHVVLAWYCYRRSSVRLSVCDVDVP